VKQSDGPGLGQGGWMAATRMADLVLYEYPFNEGIRTKLRLEHLFERLAQLVPRDAAVDHHFALATLFEIMDVASRADLKSDLLKELERHRAQLIGYRSLPQVSQVALDEVIGRIDTSFARLNAQPGKSGQSLTTNDWLMGVRSRINIPGGTCAFDLPGYYAWQQHEPERRRADLVQWLSTLSPLADALNVLLQLMRDAGTPHKVIAQAGLYQQSLSQGKVYHLLRVRMLREDGLVPEISGHRLMVSIRLMRPDAEGRLKPAVVDHPLEMTLCA